MSIQMFADTGSLEANAKILNCQTICKHLIDVIKYNNIFARYYIALNMMVIFEGRISCNKY